MKAHKRLEKSRETNESILAAAAAVEQETTESDVREAEESDELQTSCGPLYSTPNPKCPFEGGFEGD